MSFVTLTTHTFLSDVTASTNSNWYPVDYRYASGDTIRTIMGTAAASANVTLDIKTSVRDGGPALEEVATTWTGITGTFGTTITKPITHVRVRMTAGAGSNVTVVGVV